MYTSGSLTHTSDPNGGGGQEFHAYPFNGDLPDCDAPQAVGVLGVEKRDAADGSQLSDAEFQLWRESNNVPGLQAGGSDPDTRVGEPCTTDSSGSCQRTASTGVYYWQETRAPEGYEPEETVVGPIAFDEDRARTGFTSVAENRRPGSPQGDIRLEKTDSETGEPLPGAVFELWRETNGVSGLQTEGDNPDTRSQRGCATDDRGRCTFPNQELGQYYLKETAVPEGYQLPSDPVFGPYRLSSENVAEGVHAEIGNDRGEPGKGNGKGR